MKNPHKQTNKQTKTTLNSYGLRCSICEHGIQVCSIVTCVTGTSIQCENNNNNDNNIDGIDDDNGNDNKNDDGDVSMVKVIEHSR